MKTTFVCALGLLATAACTSETQLPSTGSRLAVEVAPLDLPGITQATYSLTVKNSAGQVVWSESPLTSSAYGNGKGDLTYIGTCDATANPHTVELVLLSLEAGGATLSSPADYVNPTIRPDTTVVPMVQPGVVCVENGDTPVVFNLTIMRSANQGFFDIGVTFSDVFCSAKLDCKDQFLHHDGVRDATAIVGFACTAGLGQPTYLYLSDMRLECRDSNNVVSSTILNTAGAELGQNGAQGSSIFQWAVYRGQEFIGADFEKCYWNNAIGLDLDALQGKTCKVVVNGTASSFPLPLQSGQFSLPTTGSYPFIRWEGEVLAADGKLCGNLALNESNGAVSTSYVLNGTPTSAQPNLTAVMRCGEAAAVQCVAGAGTIEVAPTATGISLSKAGVTPANYNLPAGYTLGPTCCTPGCCQ